MNIHEGNGYPSKLRMRDFFFRTAHGRFTWCYRSTFKKITCLVVLQSDKKKSYFGESHQGHLCLQIQ